MNQGQAGLEYLMTYGWALIIIMTMASLLFFVYSPKQDPIVVASSDPIKFMIKGANNSENNIQIKAINVTGGRIKIKGITPPITYSLCTANGTDIATINESTPKTVNSGGEIWLQCNSTEPINGEIKIAYYDFFDYSKEFSISVVGTKSVESIVCETTCNSSCQGTACFGTDPDCDSSGNATITCCGNVSCDGTETCNTCPTDCGTCPLGQSCTIGTECTSGNCTDGVCCDNPCTGSCQYCNSSGTCTTRPSGDSTECNQCNSCDGVSTSTCTAQTNTWNQNQFNCLGTGERCQTGTCITCGGYAGTDGLGGTGCWYLAALNANCSSACTAYGGYVATAWNDNTSCGICRYFNSTATCGSSANSYAPFYTPGSNNCSYRSGAISYTTKNSTARRLCNCIN